MMKGFLNMMKGNRSIGKLLTHWTERVIDVAFYLCLLAMLYLFLQVFVVTSFKIPTDSMWPTLLPGDYLLVEKCSTGARIFDVVESLEDKPVDICRMPGWRNFRRNDVLVFNFPYQERWDSIVFDVMKYYVKRCIALPGDTLEIRNGHYRIRGLDKEVGYLKAQQEIAALPDSGSYVVMSAFPWSDRLKWTIKDFGPLHVPAKGQTIKMDTLSFTFYHTLIGWEQKKRLHMEKDGSVLLGDSLIHEYRFQENYYFMAGDKATNSQDSRYWGLLPESFIVGRAVRIWKSVHPYSNQTRWDRVWKKVK